MAMNAVSLYGNVQVNKHKFDKITHAEVLDDFAVDNISLNDVDAVFDYIAKSFISMFGDGVKSDIDNTMVSASNIEAYGENFGSDLAEFVEKFSVALVSLEAEIVGSDDYDNCKMSLVDGKLEFFYQDYDDDEYEYEDYDEWDEEEW